MQIIKKMKKLNVLLAALVGIVSFGACMKDDGDSYDPYAALQQEAPIIAHYVDSLKAAGDFSSNVKLDENTGIWYDIIEPGDNSYTFEFDTIGGQVYLPQPDVRVNYTGKLLNGTTFDSNQKADGFKFTLGDPSIINAWTIMFYPKEISDNPIGGVTTSGLTSGAIVHFVAPSPYCYQNIAQQNIPANSPLDFTIKVLSVEDPDTDD